jgi:outer membrane immunogenic protein
VRTWLAISAAVVGFAGNAAADDSMVTKALAIPFTGPAYNWTGFYAGGHIGGAFFNGRRMAF